jgi:hypothetical protein
VKALLGGILLAIGILIAGASGLCSLVMFAGAFTESDPGSTIAMVTIVGGPPFLIGVGLFLGGRALLKSDRPKPPAEVPPVQPGDQP